MLVVDFAPHDIEFLREQHAHRRLGFEAAEVSCFGKAAGLKKIKILPLEGGKLTVTIWQFEKTKSVQPTKSALKVVS